MLNMSIQIAHPGQVVITNPWVFSQNDPLAEEMSKIIHVYQPVSSQV